MPHHRLRTEADPPDDGRAPEAGHRPGTDAGVLRSQRLLALFAVGWLLLNVPLLTLWDRPVRLAGLPLAPLALFVGWAVLIALAGWVAESRDTLGRGRSDEPPPRTGPDGR